MTEDEDGLTQLLICLTDQHLLTIAIENQDGNASLELKEDEVEIFIEELQRMLEKLKEYKHFKIAAHC